MSSPPFVARTLDPLEVPLALDLTRRLSVLGIYVQNHLLAGSSSAEVLALHGAEEMLGLVYCGDRGNLIILTVMDLDPEAVAQAILDTPWSWRIVLGPAAPVAVLRRLDEASPLVHRAQIYYAVEPDAVPADQVRDDVRLARKQDVKALVEATLDLNEIDLGVQAWRVNRDWVRQNVRQRIREETTLVIGPPGRPLAKLDIGSDGPAGLILEGVYTWPEHRRRGYAAGLVATAVSRVGPECPIVCLHVAEDNVPGRRAYENAGMREAGGCSLLLRS